MTHISHFSNNIYINERETTKFVVLFCLQFHSFAEPSQLIMELRLADSHPILSLFRSFPAISQKADRNRESDLGPPFPLLALLMQLSVMG